MIARKGVLISIIFLVATVLAFSFHTATVQARVEKKSVSKRKAAKGKQAFYTPGELAAIFRHFPKPPLPPDPTNKYADNPRAAILGQALFFDRRLSAKQNVSCATCHIPQLAFTDGRRFIRKITPDSRNTQTLINVAYNTWFFWDGRSDSLWSQALRQIESPKDLNGDRLHIVRIVKKDPGLQKAYQEIFGTLPNISDARRFPEHARPDPDPLTALSQSWKAMTVMDQTTIDRVFSNLGKAIESYERLLVSHDAPFDRYVAGLKTKNPAMGKAISAAAKRGLKLFVGAAHCDSCHTGPNFTDGRFHNLGLPVMAGKNKDPGRAEGIRSVLFDPFNRRGRYSDNPNRESGDRFTSLPAPKTQLGAFRTPSLRNVLLTAPYMHDGRFSSLNQVLDFYARGKKASHGRLVGKRDKILDHIPHLTPRQKSDLIAFLKTLTEAPLPSKLRYPPPHP